MIGENKQGIATQLNDLIYSGGELTVDDILDLVGDGDPFEYL